MTTEISMTDMLAMERILTTDFESGNKFMAYLAHLFAKVEARNVEAYDGGS
ncbi:MAG TPA: hypothetical protein VKP88_00235 [Candidatus Paceibacterota bacterium]|nr:hypothetical protein [Candidatus Paceibacterota bacterium]